MCFLQYFEIPFSKLMIGKFFWQLFKLSIIFLFLLDVPFNVSELSLAVFSF